MTRLLRDLRRPKSILTRAIDYRHGSIRFTLRYAGVSVVVGALWLLASRWVAPALIAAMYRERSLGFLNDLLSGRGVHPVSKYLGDWQAVARTIDAALLVTVLFVYLAWLARVTRRAGQPNGAHRAPAREEPRSRLRRHLVRAALVLTGTIVGLGIGEILVRLFPGSISEVTRGRMSMREMVASETRSVAAPYLGFRYPPHTTDTLRRGDFEFSYTTDGHGFRNAWPWPEQVDVVTIGDSFTFGYGVEMAQAWVTRLDHRLGERRIINLGLIGAAPQQYLRVYETFGAGLRPRLVLLGLLPGGDLGDVRLFDAWERAGSPGNYDVWRFFRGDPPSANRQIRRVLERSRLYWLIRDLRGRATDPDRFRWEVATLPNGVSIPLALGYLERLRPRARPDHPDFQRVVGLVDETRAVVETSGAELVVVLMPSREAVYAPLVGIDVLDVTTPLRETLEWRGHRVVDLTPALRTRGAQGELMYFVEDGHWNEAGNATVADTLFNYLMANFPELR